MKKFALDDVDIRILNAVQQHGQVSKSKLGELVNLSSTPCLLRLTKLKNAGYITGFSGRIALHKMFDLTSVFVTVSLASHRRSDFEIFEKYIQSVDEIVECYATGGGNDYVLKFVTLSLQEFQQLIESMLDADIGISRYYIYVTTKTIKRSELSVAKLAKKKHDREKLPPST